MHFSSKTYGHEQGLSATFRQWRAQSHCNKLHGYALSIGLTFQAASLDERNWVVDFGALKPLKERLQRTFDHKTIVAQDDPALDSFELMSHRGLIDLVVMKEVGCEAFAKHVHGLATEFLREVYVPQLAQAGIEAPAWLVVLKAEVREHGANSGSYFANEPQYVTDGLRQLVHPNPPMVAAGYNKKAA